MLNVATPATAATVVVPVSVPLPGLIPMVMTTLPTKPVAVLPKASCAVTETAGDSVAPAPVDSGWPVNTMLAAEAATMVSDWATDVRLPDVAPSVYPVLAFVSDRFVNVATPATAATVSVPVSVPAAGFATSASVTLPVNAVTIAPAASRACTTTDGKVAPAVTEGAGDEMTSCVAGP